MRAKLPQEELITIDWNLIVSTVKWLPNLNDVLCLPSEFSSPPSNKMQFYKQSKVLSEKWLTDKEIENIYDDSNPDVMAGKIVNAIIREKTIETLDIVEKLGGHLHVSQIYLFNLLKEDILTYKKLKN